MTVIYPLRLFLDCSTAHLSPAARTYLEIGDGIASATPYGWFVYASEEPEEHVPADLERSWRMLPLPVIQAHVANFLDYARQRPGVRFELTPIGCGLAGYRPEQIAPMFSNAPANVMLPETFAAFLTAGPPG